jgi:hypothetical protein
MAVRWRSVHRVGARPRRRARLLIASAALPLLSLPAIADPDAPAIGREVWAGADVSSNVWLAYSGVTLAPWSGIYDNGVRFRAAGGYGEYSYDKRRNRDPLSDDERKLDFNARTYFADILVGYLQRFGELTAKAFVGASVVSHDIAPLDPETVAIGEEIGVKGVLELWLNIGDRGWGSLDLSWSSAHDTRAARARIGYRVWPRLSLGLEAGINVDAQGECRLGAAGASECVSDTGDPVEPAELLDYARGGAFARYEWERGEVSLSAGILGDSFANGGETELAPYVTVNWLTQF